MKEKKFRVDITTTRYHTVEVWAADKWEAREKATDSPEIQPCHSAVVTDVKKVYKK